MEKIKIYDTTLRDGMQTEGISFSLEDKLAIAGRLDKLGVDYVEGGYPASSPKESQFFAEVANMGLGNCKIVAFGNTRRADTACQQDASLNAILDCKAPAATIVGKTWDLHVTSVLRCSLDENIVLCADSIAFLKKHGLETMFDAEHFYDGYRENPEYAMKVLKAVAEAGVDAIVLCDTNGGTLPAQIYDITAAVCKKLKPLTIGIHTHNDCDCAIAGAVAAVHAGARQVQGTINGLGERCGNANLCTLIPNLAFKLGFEVSAFAHKAGLHVDAIRKVKRSYEHINPELVGNERKFLISELSGKSNILAELEKSKITQDFKLARKILARVQELENQGYQFEAANASFDLLVRKIMGTYKPAFEMIKYTTTVEKFNASHLITEATVKLKVGDKVELVVGEGDGPVNALDAALRKSLDNFYPNLRDMHLIDYKVRVVNAREGTAARVRVVIESRDKTDIWGTVGVSENIIEASWLALVDSVEYKLHKDAGR
ncbi:MAG: citramalate synthase [Sedimentisphaerales bacterium]